MTEPNARETLRAVERAGAAPRRPAAPPLPNQLGPYLLLDELGAGGMGRVFRALHTRLKRVVALKLLPDGRMNNAQAVARFQHEMEAVGCVDHPHVVRATDADEDGGHHYLVMEYVEGLDLDRLLRRAGPLRIADACELARQAADGLQAAHEHGLVHRDIKPSNLMLSRAGQVKLLDLGLARLGDAGPGSERLTPSGEVMGTPDFMAPEQAFDAQKVDIRADLYSLGCTLYKLLSGQPPFGGPEYTSRMQKLMAHAQEPVPPVRDARPDVPGGLSAVLDRLLSKEPPARHATPAEAARALAAFAGGADLSALIGRVWAVPDPAPPEEGGAQEHAETRPYRPLTADDERDRPAAPPARPRRRSVRALLAAVALAGAGLLVGLFVSRRPPPGEEPRVPPPRVLRPGTWAPLLDRAPARVFWRNPAGDQRFDFDVGRQEAHVVTRELALLGLGEVAHEGYKFQLGIRQVNWAGGVGLFFGHQPSQHKGSPCVKYQYLELRQTHRGPGEPAFLLHRGWALIVDREKAPPVFDARAVLAEPLTRSPTRDEQILEVRVGRSGLTRVNWAGQDLRALVSDRANKDFTAADYAGRFGIFVSGAEGTFQNARLMVFEKE